ncbi:transposase, partial [Aestuariimicrobium sp. p3-SID1156]|uniref:transposase n=1 Tax=Aestuariimicrobium sp. p3-SID1156 TaxID=2916038 RepID=UPI00223B0AD4
MGAGDFGYASKRHWPEIAVNLRPVYEAPTPEAAERAFAEFAEKWGKAYPAMIRLWRNAWTEFVPLPRLRRRDPQGPLLH